MSKNFQMLEENLSVNNYQSTRSTRGFHFLVRELLELCSILKDNNSSQHIKEAIKAHLLQTKFSVFLFRLLSKSGKELWIRVGF